MPKRIPATEKLRRAVLQAEARGMTRGEIARASGLSVTGVSKFVGGGEVRLSNAEKMAEAIGYQLRLTPGR